MGDRKTVKVGIFADKRSDGAPIPPSMVGRRIYYNYDREFFIITDDNNKYSSRFYPEKFLQFVDVDAIVFTNETVGKNIIDECLRITGAGDVEPEEAKSSKKRKADDTRHQDDSQYAEYADDWADEYEDDWEDEYDDEDDTSSALLHQHGTPQSEDVRPSSTVKDPTRHLFAFCVTTLVLVIVFAIIVLLGRPILSALQPLLPG